MSSLLRHILLNGWQRAIIYIRGQRTYPFFTIYYNSPNLSILYYLLLERVDDVFLMALSRVVGESRDLETGVREKTMSYV
jgi:hypothetical protein